MGSIRLRGDGQIQARVRKRGWPEEVRTFLTKTEAKDWIVKTEADMNAGRFVNSRPAERMTLAEAMDDWAKVAKTELKHFDVEEGRIRRLKQLDISKHSIARLTTALIEELVDDMLERDYSPTTIRLYLSIISRSWRRAMKHNTMVRCPTEDVDNLSASARRHRRLVDGEEAKLLAEAEPEFRRIIEFAIETAARRAEIANLEWVDVSLPKRTAVLRETKNPKGQPKTRTLPLSPRALEILRSMPRPIAGGPVFDKSPHAITKCMVRVCKKAKIKDLRFHDLRHEAVSRLFENTDLSELEIMEISGHQSVQMLKSYTHMRSGRLADRLAGVKRGDTKTA